MVKVAMREAQSSIVGNYLRERQRQLIVEHKDPIGMATNGLIDGVMRQLGKEVARDVLREIVFETMIESQFIKMFSRDMLPRQLRAVAEESVREAFVQEQARRVEEEVMAELVP